MACLIEGSRPALRIEDAGNRRSFFDVIVRHQVTSRVHKRVFGPLPLRHSYDEGGPIRSAREHAASLAEPQDGQSSAYLLWITRALGHLLKSTSRGAGYGG